MALLKSRAYFYGKESEVDKLLLPIIMICVCALLGGGTLIFLKLSAKHKKSKNKDKEELAQITANEFVNVKDIRGNFLYTRDNLALAYLKIYPISTELFSKNEKRLIAKQLTVSLSSAQYPFQLLAVSRPVDISPLLSELSATLTSSSDVKQKELLKQEIVEMGAFALSGEVVERQFYIKIWDREAMALSAICFRSSMTCTDVSLSSAPVGSSASKISGSLTSARAIATRCICPPDIWLGFLCSWSPRPTFFSACTARFLRSDLLTPESVSASSTFCRTVWCGIRL